MIRACPGILSDVVIDPDATVAEALSRLDQAGTGALVVSMEDAKLFGLLTDGDIRRAIMRGIPLEDPCGTVATRNPVTARDSISALDALHLMTQHDISHLPLVDEEGKLCDFVLRKDLAPEEGLDQDAKKRLESVIILPEMPINEALFRLDQAGTGALAVCGADGRLRGLVTDGDIRRAVLRGVSLGDPSGTIASSNPITARGPIAARDALLLMTRHDINHLPLVDEEGKLIELLLRRDLIAEPPQGLSAVIMAGGYGKRLFPLTQQVPKPMLPVGDRPLLERTLQQLRRSGIREVNLTTHYLPDCIVRHFGDGEDFGVKLTYSNEDEPLGTAGGLRLIKRPDRPFLVINGDILTGVSFQDMLHFHQKYGADLTVGVRKHSISVPFGVVECDDVQITQVREKPSVTLFINAGIYLLEPTVCDLIPEGVHFDMTDLINLLVDEGRPVVSFPVIEYWQDVGRHEDYEQAQHDVSDGLI